MVARGQGRRRGYGQSTEGLQHWSVTLCAVDTGHCAFVRTRGLSNQEWTWNRRWKLWALGVNGTVSVGSSVTTRAPLKSGGGVDERGRLRISRGRSYTGTLHLVRCCSERKTSLKNLLELISLRSFSTLFGSLHNCDPSVATHAAVTSEHSTCRSLLDHSACGAFCSFLCLDPFGG